MGLINPPEWAACVRSLKWRPYLAIVYAADLGLLLVRRVRQTMQLRMCGSLHRGVKMWPHWLGDRALLPSPQSDSLRLPVYPLWTGSLPSYAEVALSINDPEAVFARHRWAACLIATLDPEREMIALTEVRDWLEAPPPRADAAWETYSCCERVVNLTVLLAARPALLAQFDPNHLQNLLEESLHWINARLEYYGGARTNNHILNNARALIVLGSVLDNPAALERGLHLFVHMAARLFQPGGFLRERSSHYQLVVTNWVLDAVHFAGNASALTPDAQTLLQTLQALALRVAEASAWLVNHHGGVADHVGDISPDATPLLSLLRLQALYPQALRHRIPEHAQHIDDWFCVRHEEDCLLACVPSAAYPLPYATHGHADLGSFVWRRAGRTLLADAGRGSYANPSFGRCQISASGHNTVYVDGLPPLAESLLYAGIWLPLPYAEARIEAEVQMQGFNIAHDGFARGGKVQRHRRSISLDTSGLTVVDDFQGEGQVLIELFWHFPPGCAAPTAQQVSVAHNVYLNHDSHCAGDHVTRTWGAYAYAHAYGKEEEAAMLHEQWHVTLPCSIRTRFEVSLCAA